MFKNKGESTSIMTVGGEPWGGGRDLGDGLRKRYPWPLVSQEQGHECPMDLSPGLEFKLCSLLTIWP